jgi:hypothetical protein
MPLALPPRAVERFHWSTIEPFNFASAMQRASKYTESINHREYKPQTCLLNLAKELRHRFFTVQNAFARIVTNTNQVSLRPAFRRFISRS